MASTGGRVQDPWDAEFIALRNWAQGDDGVTLTRSPQLGAERYRVKLTVNANHNNDIEERLIPIIHGTDAVGEMDLELLSCWWHWPEFTILGNGRGHKLKTCYLRFFGDYKCSTGLVAHQYIFQLWTLESLTIENHPEMVEDFEPLDFELSKVGRPITQGASKLKTLRVSGVDIMTLMPALAFSWRCLETLELEFTAPGANALIRSYMQRGTAELLDEAFKVLFDKLRHLTFYHHYLNEYRWGKFKALETLRVHQDHIFPTYRPVSIAPQNTLLPSSLRHLTIHGCQFAEKKQGDASSLEELLLFLAEELLYDNSVSLEKITLVLAGDSLPVPGAVVEALKGSRIQVVIVPAGTEPGAF